MIVVCSSVAPEQSTIIQGRFSNKSSVNKSRQLDWLGLKVKLKVGRTTIAETVVQANGHFNISSASNTTVDLVYSGISIGDDVYLATIQPYQSSRIKLQFELPVSTMQKHGVIKCPKCRRKDKVLPIDGRAGVVVATADGRGDTIFLPYDKRHYYPSSDVSSWLDPHWHCLRDTINF